MYIITGRNEVMAKVIFLQACVCPRGGGGVLNLGGLVRGVSGLGGCGWSGGVWSGGMAGPGGLVGGGGVWIPNFFLIFFF